MKPFPFHFSGACLTWAVTTSLSPAIQAAPVDAVFKNSAVHKESLPWLGSTQNDIFDEFSRAANALEAARAAEKTAARRFARGEITRKEWQTAYEALQRAEQHVKELLTRNKSNSGNSLSNAGKAAPSGQAPFGGPVESSPARSSLLDTSKTQMPFLISMPPETPKRDTANSTESVIAGNVVKPASASAIFPAPGVTHISHASDGSITPPAYGNRQMLHGPQKAGERQLFAFVASLPQKGNAAREANLPRPVVSPPVASVAPVVKITRPEPKVVVPQAKVAAKSETKPGGFSSVELQRLAQLDAELRRADRRLNAANQALSDGQEQLNRFAGTLRQAMLEAGPDAAGLHPFVKVAEKYAGTPYVWGGESRRGFDCSGMIIRVMRDLGYKALPHSAAEQYKYGKPIAQPLLKPGDLVFFANTYKAGISHVGIYLGKRRFIHAAGTGKGTIVSSLDESKFQAKYAGARRLIAARN